jgi:histidinol-phosphatase
MDPDLSLALTLADLAAQIALPRFEDRRFTVTLKPDGSPVTDVDRAVERALRERLSAERPAHAILGEEYGASGESPWRWYLDPIDGTSRFVVGDPNWMTFVALEHEGDVVVGVIAVPALGQRWWAARGAGAFHDGRRIAVSQTARLADAAVNDDWYETASDQDEDPADPLRAVTRRAARVGPGAGHGFLAVAAGMADVALARGGHAWDYAAPRILVEEAGGRFTDLAGHPRLDADVAVASNGVLHDEVLTAARTSGAG